MPKIPSYRVVDVAKAVAPEADLKTVGIRPGEKLHEEMITSTDSLSTIEFDDYYVILPSRQMWDVEEFIQRSSESPGRRCDYGFEYESGGNPEFLTVEQIRELIATEM